MPTSEMTEADLHWVAGFLEGEGNFHKGYGARMSAAQVNPEPLVKMINLCGGRVVELKQQRPEQQRCLQWRLGSDAARELMRRIYPLMSTRRRKQMAPLMNPAWTRRRALA